MNGSQSVTWYYIGIDDISVRGFKDSRLTLVCSCPLEVTGISVAVCLRESYSSACSFAHLPSGWQRTLRSSA
jgi:hypothetical protein